MVYYEMMMTIFVKFWYRFQKGSEVAGVPVGQDVQK